MDITSKPPNYFNNTRKEMLAFLPEDAKTILDVGCGDGTFGKALKELTGGEIWGIEYEKGPGEEARTKMDNVLIGDAHALIKEVPDKKFDVIYCNDVLEHLADPYTVLEDAKQKLTPGGIVVSSIPNIRYHRAIFPILFRKEFRYKEYGVMDKTHLRFFTGKSIRRMYEEAGYEVTYHKGVNTSRSLRPYLYNIPLFFTALDIRHPQYATVAKVNV